MSQSIPEGKSPPTGSGMGEQPASGGARPASGQQPASGGEQPASGGGQPPTRLFVRERDAILPVELSAVLRFEADSDYVTVFTAGRTYLMRENLHDLEMRLGPEFLRVHRSHLVNLAHVVRFERSDGARLRTVMSDGSSVRASRAGSQLIRQLAR